MSFNPLMGSHFFGNEEVEIKGPKVEIFESIPVEQINDRECKTEAKDIDCPNGTDAGNTKDVLQAR